MKKFPPVKFLACAVAGSMAAAAGLSCRPALANSTMLGDINGTTTGGVTYQTNIWQEYTYTFTASVAQTYITFLIRNDPSYVGLDDIALKAQGSSTSLLVNGGLETVSSTTTSAGAVPANWTVVGTTGLDAAGRLENASAASNPMNGSHSGSYYWLDGAVGGYDGIAQLVDLVVGDTYTLTFWLGGSLPNGTTTDYQVWEGSLPTGISSLSTNSSSTNIDTSAGYYAASALGNTVNPAFQGGVLRIDTSGSTLSQNFTLDGSSTNTIDQYGNTVIFSGVFSDATNGTPGNIIIANTGTGGEVVFAGANTYTGTTTIESGATLALANTGSISSSSVIRVDGTLDATSLAVSGWLRGSGLVNAATTVNGTLAPGDSPGTLSFTSPLTLAAGSTSEFDIDGTGTGTGAGNYARIISTSSVTVDGTLEPLLRGIEGNASNSFVPSIGEEFTIISAAGGISGSYAAMSPANGAVTGLPAGTRFDAIYEPTTLTLVVTPYSYGNLAAAGLSETASEASVGAALDTVRPAAGVRMSSSDASLFYPLYALPGSAIAPALNQLVPSIYGAGMLAGRDAWGDAADAVSNQLAGRHAGSPGDGDNTITAHGYTFWTTALGRSTQTDGDAGYSYHSSTAGILVGADTSPLPGATLGIAAGGSRISASGGGATLDGPAAHLALYGGYQSGNLFADAQASFFHADTSARRTLGYWAQTVTGHSRIDGGGVQFNTGTMLEAMGWHFEPTIGAAAASFSSGALTESGNQPFAESVGGSSVTSLRSRVGLRIGTTFLPLDELPTHVHASVGWDHEFADAAARGTASFASLDSGTFTYVTPRTGRDTARLGGGFSMDVAPAVSLYADYQAALATHATSHAVSGGLRMIW